MANLPRRSENPNDTQPSDAVPTYPVGYGYAPPHTAAIIDSQSVKSAEKDAMGRRRGNCTHRR